MGVVKKLKDVAKKDVRFGKDVREEGVDLGVKAGDKGVELGKKTTETIKEKVKPEKES